ncbi:hypothetical protein AJ80_06725 [Polytolypa hystricis UAMH7299]|uniref:AAA+ ATPase domain-containing protein n=1 Tax=Polytolypa hystricis (strain UAMH7299) TaxID=1447883 RepID=A0A2B7XV13_POLH7|nr:hypothetical protein AJ80_06725 [Polytolypa hystricis UAMH7299]
MSFGFMAATARGNSNDSVPMSFTNLPNNVLEALVPGYSLISGFILQVFGFDISVVVSTSALIFAVTTALNYTYKGAYSLVMKYFTSSVTVDSHDDIYAQVIAWMSSQQGATKRSRSLRAKSGVHTAWDEEDADTNCVSTNDQNNPLLDFSNWEARVPPRFEPHTEPQWFWHKGHCFRFKRQKEMVLSKRNMLSGMFTEDESITLTVFGRSVRPLRELIIEARDASLIREKARTCVRRPGPKEFRSRGYYAWSKVATRPSRPIDTVVLDHKQKNKILADINEYLHPATPRWYANRGIPYRRGYLFYGPPGTGKTSLSFAIAGVFGLEIFCISLLDPSLAEEELGLMFNSLPRRCVVLLEDIDTAGLGRKTAEDSKPDTEKKDDGSNTSAAEEAENKPRSTTRKIGSTGRSEDSKGISLSGLLNAIDGVASHEGRVLVMTTNHPENLDEALIRPGRIDMKIEFTLSTRQQIREIFIRMYSSGKNEISPSLARLNSLLAKETQEASATSSPPSAISSKLDVGPTPFGKKPLSPPATPINETNNSDLPQEKQTPSSRPDITTPRPIQTGAPHLPHGAPTPPSSSSGETSNDSPTIDTTDTFNIHKLADKFADLLPEDVFSPAEIQGYLLTRKTDPWLAVKEATQWCKETLATKNNKKRDSSSSSSNSTRLAEWKDETKVDNENGDCIGVVADVVPFIDEAALEEG